MSWARNLRQSLAVWPIKQAIKLGKKETFHEIVVCDLTWRVGEDPAPLADVKTALATVAKKMPLRQRLAIVVIADITPQARLYDLKKVLLLKKQVGRTGERRDHYVNAIRGVMGKAGEKTP
jgi:hypothetical protein